MKKDKKGAHSKPISLASRVCHDCGRSTPDYRCPKCREAWRKKHGVSGWGISDEDDAA